ncbi:MAG: bifunctional hydroxymethylpyrimidine kinase/phosphomethylpyrimidine kinase [Thaumarchaeota archaeon]|nr:bifunctional hydroxymethylpyrimidine kinase/phosphomethylpyrimidine kinase [Nitrososphaerota archaeon]
MNVLTIAGSDPSSGAGIQGDIKTFNAMGLYGLTVITAITSQNSSRFFRSEPASAAIIRSQLRAVLSDFRVEAIKIGMVYNEETIDVLRHELAGTRIPIVLDPVFRATTGGTLLQEGCFHRFKRSLIPLAHIITPNVPEAEKLSGIKIKSMADARKAAKKIVTMGAKNVVIKGGHMNARFVTDLLLEDNKFHSYSLRRLSRETHGGGCIFSAALCGNIAKGMSIPEAVKEAQKISFESIKSSRKAGGGFSIAVQKDSDSVERELAIAISEFVSSTKAYMHIPEVQTNFVYSRAGPMGLSDILGIEGRIVRTGHGVLVSGSLKYGASRHVARALLEVSRKFPATRSAINIKYDKRVIERAAAKRLQVANYERAFEPDAIKKAEGMSVSWGVKNAIAKLKKTPDLVYHTGDIGKESMIIIFGRNPKDVLTKFYKIT